MGVLPQSMTELIAPLEKSGAITRRPDAGNNRILRIELTAVGERLFAKAAEIAIRLERELYEDFDERELGRLNRLLTELTAKAEAHSLHPKVRRLATKLKAARGTTKVAVRRAGARR